jgi:predicted regulator of Ras-like GTPase activity (Roadblock/LC7/MglB family)
MADATLTPDRAADYFEGLSPDVKACVLVGADGRVAAADSGHEGDADELGELATALLERADAPQVEVSTGSGIVYALRSGDWTLAVVASRLALSALVFFDMRKTLEELAA